MADESPKDDPPEKREAEQELRIAPLPEQPKSAEANQLPPLGPDYFGPRKDASLQFSLTQFLIWISVISIGLSGLSWLPREIFAGVCGILAIVLIGISTIAGRTRSWTVIAYAFLAMYLIAMVIVLFTLRRSAN